MAAAVLTLLSLIYLGGLAALYFHCEAGFSGCSAWRIPAIISTAIRR